jgi:hypothetical protein
LAISQEGSIATSLQAEQTGRKCKCPAEIRSSHRDINDRQVAEQI